MAVRKVPVIFDWSKLPPLIDDLTVSAMIGISTSTLRKARMTGATKTGVSYPPFVKLGRKVLYRTDDVRTWIDALCGREAI
jgi:predicted DNA-binding transcriptional regulator AlpA